MKAFSSALSITAHVVVGVAVLVGTTKTGQSIPRYLDTTIIPYPPVTSDGVGRGLPIPDLPSLPDLRSIPMPSTLTPAGIMTNTGAAAPWLPSTSGDGVDAADGSVWSVLPESQAEVLTAPLPTYPELLRQAGLQGMVVLEAVVDTTGRVLPQSISVVSATNPGFVAPARQALMGTLFRPAMAGGKPVRLRVRIPYDFTLRTGMGPAR
jgi:TonB family protein